MKTRLAAAIGHDLAVEVYRALTTAVMNSTTAVHSSERARVVCFWPQDAGAEIAAWLGGEVLEPQDGVDLGARMDRAFANSFARGSTATVLIGTDSLGVDRLAVAAAFAALDTADVVLRGAVDGGYTLIGLKRRQPSLFTDIAWSTDTVMATALARASASGLRVAVHGHDADIDTLDDLRRHWVQVRPYLDDDVARRIEGTAFSSPPA